MNGEAASKVTELEHHVENLTLYLGRFVRTFENSEKSTCIPIPAIQKTNPGYVPISVTVVQVAFHDLVNLTLRPVVSCCGSNSNVDTNQNARRAYLTPKTCLLVLCNRLV